MMFSEKRNAVHWDVGFRLGVGDGGGDGNDLGAPMLPTETVGIDTIDIVEGVSGVEGGFAGRPGEIE